MAMFSYLLAMSCNVMIMTNLWLHCITTMMSFPCAPRLCFCWSSACLWDCSVCVIVVTWAENPWTGPHDQTSHVPAPWSLKGKCCQINHIWQQTRTLWPPNRPVVGPQDHCIQTLKAEDCPVTECCSDVLSEYTIPSSIPHHRRSHKNAYQLFHYMINLLYCKMLNKRETLWFV